MAAEIPHPVAPRSLPARLQDAWRTVPVFVASTFHEFHEHRSSLAGLAARLNARLAGQSVDVVFVDLRWGAIADEGNGIEVERVVLERCLEEIERCPIVIGLLGCREGWTPDRDLLRAVAARHRLDLPSDVRSVTQLEVEAAVSTKGPNTLLYCLADDRASLPAGTRRLVDRCRRAGGTTRQFPETASVATVIQDVEADLGRLVAALTATTPVPGAGTVDRHRRLAPLGAWDLVNLQSWLTRHGRTRVHVGIHAADELPGSALLAALAVALEDEGHDVLLHSVRSDQAGRDLVALLHAVAAHLGVAMASEATADEMIVALRADLRGRVRPLHLLLDRPDLLDLPPEWSAIGWADTIDAGLVLVFTAVSRGGTVQMKLRPLADDDLRAYVRRRASASGRVLGDAAVEAICTLESNMKTVEASVPLPESLVKPPPLRERTVPCAEDRTWLAIALDDLLAPDAPWVLDASARPAAHQQHVVLAAVEDLPRSSAGLANRAVAHVARAVGPKPFAALAVALRATPWGARTATVLALANDLMNTMEGVPATPIGAGDLAYVRDRLPTQVVESADHRWHVVNPTFFAAVDLTYQDQTAPEHWHRHLATLAYPALAQHHEVDPVTWFRSALAADRMDLAARLIAHTAAGHHAAAMVHHLWSTGSAAERCERTTALLDAARTGGVEVTVVAVLAELLAGAPGTYSQSLGRSDQRDLADDLSRRMAGAVADLDEEDPIGTLVFTATNVAVGLVRGAGRADQGQEPLPFDPAIEAARATGTWLAGTVAAHLDIVREGLYHGDLAAVQARIARATDAAIEHPLPAARERWLDVIDVVRAMAGSHAAPTSADLHTVWRRLHATWRHRPLATPRPWWLLAGIVTAVGQARDGAPEAALVTAEQANTAAKALLGTEGSSHRMHLLYQLTHWAFGESAWAAGDGRRALAQLGPVEEITRPSKPEEATPADLLLHIAVALRTAELAGERRDHRLAARMAANARRSLVSWAGDVPRPAWLGRGLQGRMDEMLALSVAELDTRAVLPPDELQELGRRGERGVHAFSLLLRSGLERRPGTLVALARAHLERMAWHEQVDDLGRALDSGANAAQLAQEVLADASATEDERSAAVDLVVEVLASGALRDEDAGEARSLEALVTTDTLDDDDLAALGHGVAAALSPLSARAARRPTDRLVEHAIWAAVWRPLVDVTPGESQAGMARMAIAMADIPEGGGEPHTLEDADIFCHLAAMTGMIELEVDAGRARLRALAADDDLDRVADAHIDLILCLIEAGRWPEARDVAQQARSRPGLPIDEGWLDEILATAAVDTDDA